MSLARFKSSNHPQQVGVRGARDDVDDRGTDVADVMTCQCDSRNSDLNGPCDSEIVGDDGLCSYCRTMHKQKAKS